MAQDFITALVLRGDEVEMTSLKPTKTGYEVAEHRVVKVESQVPITPASPELVPAIKSLHGHLRGDLCVAISSEKTLLRVIDLPTVDAAEMKSMAELQVDKFSPFPIEHMAVSFELLSPGEKSSRVLIAAVQREVVDQWGALLGRFKLLPHWMDLEVMGWWHLLKQSREIPEKGRWVLLLMDKSGAELILSEDGIPIIFRSLGAAAGISDEDFNTELSEEISYTLTSLEAERGTAEVKQVGLWHWGETVPEDLARKLAENCGLDVLSRNFESLPTLSEGLARRTAARPPITVDLAPPEWRAKEQSRKLRKTLVIATTAFLGVWLIGIFAFFGGLSIAKGRTQQVRADVAKLEGPAKQVEVLAKKVKSFEIYSDRSRSALETLREISSVLPQGIDLTSFSYKKAGSVAVRGEAGSPEPIYDFFQALEQSKFFAKVKPEAVRSKTVGATQKSEFSVTATLPGAEEETP